MGFIIEPFSSKQKLFFRHPTNANRSLSLAAIRSQYGYAGVGRFWTLLEIAAESEKQNDFDFEIPSQSLRLEMHFRSNQNLFEFLKFLESDRVRLFKFHLLDETICGTFLGGRTH